MPMTVLLMALTIKRNPPLHDLTDGRMRATRIATRSDLKQEAFFPQAIFDGCVKSPKYPSPSGEG
jgi:hypothetical protein